MPRSSDEADRPDPEAVLRRVKDADRTRARLKIFFGFAPGVGKTFAMLESAQRLRAQGIDVVIGLVETHGRSETAALIEGLEVMPRASLSYRGHLLTEFDLQRALARKPKVLLLDELAHTNVEGSRHTQRWQDVLELLDAGIDVHTTLNVQHVESLNDVVAQITHVQVRETVPDAILDRADSIELVDLPPEELLKRLSEGKVYLPEQAHRAKDHFFREGNLLALRELALRRTAERVDDEVQAYRKLHEIEATWPAGERLVVCVGPSPGSARLVRSTMRIAAGMRAQWYAICVANPVARLNEADQQRLESHLALAESLGGEVVRLTGPVIADEVLSWAREHNITRIVLGKPTHTVWRDRLRGSLLDAIVRGSGSIDVVVLAGDEEAAPVDRLPPVRSQTPIRHWAFSAGLVALTAAGSFVLQRTFALRDPEILFLVTIMVTAAAFGRGPSLLAAGLSVAAFDLLFVPPYFTFSVTDTSYLLTFLMMFGVGVLISTLTTRLRYQELAARHREGDTRALFTLTRDLGQAQSINALADDLCRHVVEACGGQAIAFLVTENAELQRGTSFPLEVTVEANDLGVAQWVHAHQREAGKGTQTLTGSRLIALPISKTTGVLAWLPPGAVIDPERLALIEAFIKQAALALDRLQFSDAARAAVLKAKTEELRSSLLSTVSHDLRTPLAVVTGAATTLRDDTSLDAETKDQLLGTICDEADRLERLVRNLLDMTRVQAGALTVKKEWVPVDELIGSARTRLADVLGKRSIGVRIDSSLIHVDPVLFEQVLFNLLDNASKYTPAGSPLEIVVTREADHSKIELLDRGPGIVDAEQLFEKFSRGPPQGVPGAGLGLAICRGIVEAHGGHIHAEARVGGGARFLIELPLDGVPPEVPEEEP